MPNEGLVCSTGAASCPSCTPLSIDDAFSTVSSNDRPKEDARDAQEAAQLDRQMQAEGVAEIEEERATQTAAVADGVDPKKEAARIRDRHIRDAVSPEYFVWSTT